MVRFDSFEADSQFKKTIDGRSTRPAGCRCWSTASSSSTTRWPSASTWPRPIPTRRSGRATRPLRAHARSVCAEMHAGFGALRSHCGMNIEADLRVQGQLHPARPAAACAPTSRASCRCGAACSRRTAGRCCSANSASPTRTSRRSACASRPSALPVPAAITAYIERVQAAARRQGLDRRGAGREATSWSSTSPTASKR